MAKRGRHAVYTPETVGKIVDAIKLGGTDKDACEYAGISQQTFYRWMKEHREFCEQITRTRTRGKLAIIGSIIQAGEKDWRARAWYAERRWPQEYAQQLVVRVNPEDMALLNKMGFTTPSEAWQALLDNARQEFAIANSDS